jgi:hypothetical protein
VTDSPAQDEVPGGLNVPKLTWAVLLGRWIDFARSALALPDDETGHRLRDSVPDIIMLQAVWFALAHLDELDTAQRGVGLDKAQVLIEKHAQALRKCFGPEVPPEIRSLLDDTLSQLATVMQRCGRDGPGPS